MILFLFSCVFDRGEKTTPNRANLAKTGSIAHPARTWGLGGRRARPTNRHSALTDDHFSKRLSLLIVPIGGLCILERKHAVDDGLEPPLSDGTVHGEELRATPSEDGPHRDEAEEEGTEVDGRYIAGEPSNLGDLSLNSSCLDRLLKRAGADALDDMIGASTICQFAYRFMPVGRCAVVDDLIGTQCLEPLRLLLARCGHNDVRAKELGELKGEEGDPP